MNTACKQMKQYIDRTKMSRDIRIRYDISVPEIKGLWNMWMSGQSFEMIGLAFNFGRAKGYRAAKSETAKQAKA